MVRAGTLLPLLPPDVDTLADYGKQPSVVHLSDRRDEIRLLAWPAGESQANASGTLFRSSTRSSGWRLAVGRRGLRSLEIEAVLDARPRQVRWNGRVIKQRAWSFSEECCVCG